MTDTPGYLEAQQLRAEAQRLRDEAAELNATADRKLRDGNYALGQARHRLDTVTQMERSIAAREQKLKELGEPELVAREQAAEAKLKQARELMAAYSADKHSAAIYLRQCSEREAAERDPIRGIGAVMDLDDEAEHLPAPASPDRFGDALALIAAATSPKVTRKKLLDCRRLQRDIAVLEERISKLKAEVEQTEARFAAREAALYRRETELSRREAGFEASLLEARDDLRGYYDEIAQTNA